jgi:uncharacterized protein with PQ loop repeat
MEGIHHIHKRKRVHQKLGMYPHPNKWVKFLDRLLLFVAVMGPLLTLPQILKIYVGQNATGVSVLSWGFYALFNIPWIIYGVVHKDKPIMIGYSLWLVTNIVVVVGVLIY